jgi:glycosyltransferase involved in cell wall biosynthesis
VRPSGARLAGKRLVFVLAGEVVGGAEQNALNLARHFADVEGSSVEVCALDDKPGRAREIAEAEGIPWSSVRTPWVGSRSAKTVALGRIVRGLRCLRPDILLPSTNLPNVVCGLTWPLVGAKLCIWNQCDVLGTKRFSPTLFRRALHAAPLVVTTAFHVQDWLIDEWDADPTRIHVVRSEVRLPAPRDSRAVWRGRLGVEPGRLVACMLGHLHSGKDHTTLLRAWRIVTDRLRAQGVHPLLLIAGRPAGTEDAVKALAFDLNLRDDVMFLGDVADVSGLLAAADFAVFSSVSEALGRGATEPMSAGLAVVGTDVPGVREALGDVGRPYLAPPRDADGLANAILRVGLDPSLRESLGEANRRLIRERQCREATTEMYASLLKDALGHRGSTPTAQFRV